MKVILKETVDTLGRVGDIVNVSPGFARNFLLPRGKVVVANDKNVAEMAHHRKVFEAKRAQEKANAEEVAKKLSAFSFTLKRKAGEGDKLFGSVTNGDIAEAMSAAGFSTDKKDVVLKDPLKTLGQHEVKVRLGVEVSTTVKVWIVKEE